MFDPINKILGKKISVDVKSRNNKYPSHVKKIQYNDYDTLTPEEEDTYNNYKRHGEIHSVAYRLTKKGNR